MAWNSLFMIWRNFTNTKLLIYTMENVMRWTTKDNAVSKLYPLDNNQAEEEILQIPAEKIGMP